MRCIHFLNSVDLNLGGVVCAVINFCKYMQQAGVDTYLVTRMRLEHVNDWTEGNKGAPTLVELPSQPTRMGWLTSSDCSFLESWLQPSDVVHLHGMWEPSSHRLAQICRQKQVPYCISCHGMLDDWPMSQKWFKKRLFWYLYGRRYLRGAFAVHTTALEEKRQVEPWVQGTRIEVIPLVFEMDSFLNLPGHEVATNSLGLHKDEKIVLFLSRVHLKKGVELLVDAMKIVQKEQPMARALIAGPGDPAYVEKIEQQINENGLENCVKIVGPIHGETKFSLYQRADIFALPTHQENFGFVLPEAMVCGTPVITTTGVDIWRELQSGGAQIVRRIAQEFSEKIIELMQDDQLRAMLGKQGREWVLDTLEPLKVTKQYLAMYARADAYLDRNDS